jgi:3-polyprenyl-4-hydroxybenzoate decarboxylase
VNIGIGLPSAIPGIQPSQRATPRAVSMNILRVAEVLSRFQHLGIIRAKWAALGRPMPIVLALGVEPSLPFAGGMPLPEGADESHFLGALFGEGQRYHLAGRRHPAGGSGRAAGRGGPHRDRPHARRRAALPVPPGQPAGRLGLGFGVPKILVVEDDIDITNVNEVVWAFATRAHPEHGEVRFPAEPTQVAGEVYLEGAELHSYQAGKVVYNCLLADRFDKRDRPVKGDLEHGWPAEVMQRVLGNWHTYGYRDAAS